MLHRPARKVARTRTMNTVAVIPIVAGLASSAKKPTIDMKTMRARWITKSIWLATSATQGRNLARIPKETVTSVVFTRICTRTSGKAGDMATTVLRTTKKRMYQYWPGANLRKNIAYLCRKRTSPLDIARGNRYTIDAMKATNEMGMLR